MKRFDSVYAEKAFGRFVSKVRQDENGCWLWTASCDDQGYAQIGGQYLGKPWMQKAHLFAWERAGNVVPPGFRLAHTCGNRRCVNVAHLRIATVAEQTASAIAAQVRPTRERDRERFKTFVEAHPNGCWLWTGGRMSAAGYGMFYLDGRTIGAHCASHILFNGPIPDGFVVKHSCDDKRCANPAHLSAGTHQENMQESMDRGRHLKGSQHGRAKLTEESVAAMRGEYIEGRPGEGSRLADKYRVSESLVSTVVAGSRWKHVTALLGSAPSADAPHQSPLAGEGHHKAKLTDGDVKEMRLFRQLGLGVSEMAEKYGIEKAQVSAICTGQAWGHVPMPAGEMPSGPARGSQRSELKEEDVVEMRRLRAEGSSVNALAEKFGITKTQVSAITLGKAWQHVPMPEYDAAKLSKRHSMPTGAANRNAKLDDAKVAEMRRLHAGGLGPTELGQRFGVSKCTASAICRGKTWRHVQAATEAA
jgi:plasmid maintenance system antidote protein VapI